MMFQHHIRKNEIGLQFRLGDLKRILPAGSNFLSFRREVMIYNRLDTVFRHPLLETLVHEPVLAEHLVVVDLADHQRALIWRADRLTWIVGPGLHAFWKEPHEIRVETFDVNGLFLEHERLETVLAHPERGRHLAVTQVDAHQKALFYYNGNLVRTLDPGRYVYWQLPGKTQCLVIDLRERLLDVAGQEIMTADKVSLRLNLLVTFKVVDIDRAAQASEDFQQTLYREAQLVLRAAVGTRPLDKLLADKDAIGVEVREGLDTRAAELGLVIVSIGVRDIILPGDMKHLLNQVTEAQKQAEANLIRRREETAAARSQANTAKLLAENPTLARLKEMEALQEILAGAKATFIVGADMNRQLRDVLIGSDAK